MNYKAIKQTRYWLMVESFNNKAGHAATANANDLPYVLLYFIRSGNAVFHFNNAVVSVAPGSVLWLHTPENFNNEVVTTCTGYQLKLYKPVARAVAYDPELIYHPNFGEFLLTVQHISISPENTAMVSAIFGALHEEMAEDHPLKKEIVQSYFKMLLLSVMKEVKNSQHIIEKADSRLIDQFQNLLEKNFRIKKLVADYARELLVGPGYLNEIVKRITGLSASWHIRQRIVLEAKRYGAYTDMCMKEIAYELGFLDVSHFSKYFKTVSGINFSTFIEQTHVPVFEKHAPLCM